MNRSKGNEMTNCAICNQAHESFVREMPDGSSHVYQDAATLRRRNAATIAVKIRVNALLGYDSPNMKAALRELSR